MKNNGRQRFYLWDYLWWMGEKWKQARRTGQGRWRNDALDLYLRSFDIPYDDCYYPAFFQVCRHCCHVSFSIVTFAVMSLVSRIYKWRGKAVMSHYAKCRFNELLAVLLFFLAMAIICFMMYLLDKK
ncbi:hypothetical protein NXX56_07900 [Bacteroides thetaiotaomicron]|nr:hypothetical protein [Bacteroides thetaiotaomicron]